eukprot:gene20424-24508_t
MSASDDRIEDFPTEVVNEEKSVDIYGESTSHSVVGLELHLVLPSDGSSDNVLFKGARREKLVSAQPGVVLIPTLFSAICIGRVSPTILCEGIPVVSDPRQLQAWGLLRFN